MDNPDDLIALGEDIAKMGIAFHDNGTAIVTLPPSQSSMMIRMWQGIANHIPGAETIARVEGSDCLRLQLSVESLQALGIEAPDVTVGLSGEHPAATDGTTPPSSQRRDAMAPKGK